MFRAVLAALMIVAVGCSGSAVLTLPTEAETSPEGTSQVANGLSTVDPAEPAADGSALTGEPTPTSDAELEATAETPTPEATAETPTPEVSPESSATPEVSPESSATPEVSPESSATPEVSPESSATPEHPKPEPVLDWGTIDVVGDCYTEVEFWQPDRKPSPCAEPHQMEIFYTGLYDQPQSEPYPGDQVLLSQATDVCGTMLDGLVGQVGVGRTISLHVKGPHPTHWVEGERNFACAGGWNQPVTVRLRDIEIVEPVPTPHPTPAPTAPVVPPDFQLIRPGLCGATSDLSDIQRVVECEEEHYFEAYAAKPIASSNGQLPSVVLIEEQGIDYCRAEFDRQFLGSRDDGWAFYIWIPSDWHWERDIRDLVCLGGTEQLEIGRVFSG